MNRFDRYKIEFAEFRPGDRYFSFQSIKLARGWWNIAKRKQKYQDRMMHLLDTDTNKVVQFFFWEGKRAKKNPNNRLNRCLGLELCDKPRTRRKRYPVDSGLITEGEVQTEAKIGSDRLSDSEGSSEDVNQTA